jgi:hypothetical protein
MMQFFLPIRIASSGTLKRCFYQRQWMLLSATKRRLSSTSIQRLSRLGLGDQRDLFHRNPLATLNRIDV